MKPKHHMVLLGGGRIAPNIAGVWSLKPDEVHYLVSKDQPFRHQQMRDVLDHIEGLKADNPAILVDAHDIPGIQAQVKSLVDKITQESGDATITFNVTCSSKTMSVAVYETVKQAYPVIYIDSFNNRIINWLPPYGDKPLTAPNLEMYLANFGRRPLGMFDFDALSISKQAAIELAAAFVDGGECADGLLLQMRQLGWKTEQPTRHFKSRLATQEIEMLERMAGAGLIVELDQTAAGNWKYTLPNAMHWNFIKGDWLEVYVYSQAEGLVKKDKNPFFDQIAMSVAIPSGQDQAGQREIDFVGLYGWQLVWCSCKVEANPYNKKHLDEIGTVNAMLGGQYTTPILVCNGCRTHQKYEQFSQQARNAHIVLVTREQLPEIAVILQKEATIPTYSRA